MTEINLGVPAADRRAVGREAAIAVEGVGLTYPDGTRALEEVSFDVAPGEFVAVVGPSGSGKSTLLRLAAELQRPTRGLVRRGSEEVGYVFQDPTLLPWRTVLRNVELLGQLRGVPPEERRAAAEAAIALTGLQGFERHLPRQLSGGMRMRVSLARALSLHPQIFLFDEPFGALDEITRERLNDELIRLFLRERFAALFVTHAVAEAVFLASRVVVLSDRPGRVVAEVPVPFDYPRHPELRFTPEFAAMAGRVSRHLRAASG